MGDAVQNFVDRRTMHLFFDKSYTTRRKRPPLKALVLLTELGVEELPVILSQREKLSRVFHVQVDPLGEELYRVLFQRMIGLTAPKKEVIIDAGQKGAWIVLTDAGSYFVTHVLERFFNKLYPMISRIYLNYAQMRLLLKLIRDSYHGRTAATFFTVKRERRKPRDEEVRKRKVATEILWDEDVDAEIRRLLVEGFSVRVGRLDFEVRDENETVLLQAHVTRKGLCKLRFGGFSAFYQNVVHAAIGFGLERRNFYDKRERSIEKGMIKLRPLQIEYPLSLRQDQLDDFARSITSTYSSSIIHGGNPYFIASLCDYEDGSSFNVAVLGNIVTVTPFTRATPQAVWRLLDKVQEILGDGEAIDVRVR